MHPADYVLCHDTFYGESFNNFMHIYQKRRYNKAISNLAVCHWNEHVHRKYTSLWKPNHRMPSNCSVQPKTITI